MRKLIAFTMLVASACGPSASEIRIARTSVYNTEFKTVWDAATAQMREEFPGLDQKNQPMVHEDRDKALIVTEWKRIDVDQYDTAGDSDQTHNKTASATVMALFAREMVKILPGGPPWRISVDVEAAKFVPNMSALMPYHHGAEDEPTWVQGRIDHTYAGIYDRLKPYAKAGGAGPPIVPDSMPASMPAAATTPESAPASQP